MKNYKNINNQIYALESVEFEYLLPSGCIAITAEEADAIRAAEAAAMTVIIPILTMRQARLALLAIGLLDQVEAAITTPEHRIWWDYSTTVERNHPLVITLLTAFGKTSDQIDAMFIQASTL